MTSNSESRKEDDAVMMRALNTKTETRIGFWDVRTMFSTGKLAQVTREMKENKLHILGISECRCTGFGSLRTQTEGKRKRGRPKITWRRTVESELKLLSLNWGEAAKLAKDRKRWREPVSALCATRREGLW